MTSPTADSFDSVKITYLRAAITRFDDADWTSLFWLRQQLEQEYNKLRLWYEHDINKYYLQTDADAEQFALYILLRGDIEDITRAINAKSTLGQVRRLREFAFASALNIMSRMFRDEQQPASKDAKE